MQNANRLLRGLQTLRIFNQIIYLTTTLNLFQIIILACVKCDWLHFSISMFLHVESRYFRFFARAQPTAHKSPKSSLCPTRGELLGPFSLSASARRTFLKLCAGRAYIRKMEKETSGDCWHTHTHTGVARVALIFPLSVHPLSLSAPCPAIASGRSHSFTDRDHRRWVRFRFRPA